MFTCGKRYIPAQFFIFTLFNLTISTTVCAQVKAPQITPLSPNAAALYKYTELPVNTYTGIPSISIPIYDIRMGSLTVPVTLSYHAGGIRYEEQASWVGLGWSLQSGGAINRNVKGFADEKPGGILTQGIALNQNVQPCDHQYFEGVMKKWHDVQPDEFSYSFPGKNGRFIFLPGVQQPITMPYDPIKFTATVSSGFSIVDVDGTNFRFGATETTFGGDGVYVEDYVPSTWLLTEIKSADESKKITFNYTGGESAVQKNTKRERIEVLDLIDGQPNENSPCQRPVPAVSSAITTNLSYNTSTQYFSEILFENGKIEFVQSASYRLDIYNKQRSLEFIKVYSFDGTAYQLVKSYKFIYSYFKKYDYSVLKDWKLKLDRIEVLDAGGVKQEDYGFQYHTTTFSGAINTNDINSQDYWGFYNGKPNTNLIPRITIDFGGDGGSSQTQIGGADRKVDPVYMTEGVLKRITYPTGGYTEFEFETHKLEGVNQIEYAGGLRVKRITSTASATSSPIIKTYKYGLNNSGFGYRNYSNYPGYYSSEQKIHCFNEMVSVGNVTYRTRTFTSMSSLQIDGYEGTPVLYPYVTEYFGDEVLNNGRIEYVYDHGSPASDNFYTIYYSGSNTIERQSNSWMRGKLTSRIVYSAANNKVSETSNSYQTLHTFDQIVGMMVAQRYFYPVTNIIGCYTYDMRTQYMHNYYPFRSGVLMLSTTSETVYDASGSGKGVSTGASYTYDTNYLLPLIIDKDIKKRDNGIEETLTSYIKYPFNYTFSDTPVGDAATGIKYLIDKNIFSTPIEQYQVKKVINGSIVNTGVVTGTLTTFKPSKPYPHTVWQLETPAPISLSSFGTGSSLTANSFSKNPAYKAKLFFDNYDLSGNITQVHKAEDISTSYLWGYNKTYPIAEAINGGSNEIFFDSFEEANGWGASSWPGGGSVTAGSWGQSLSYDNSYVHTGRKAGQLYNPGPNEISSHSKWLNIELSSATKFKYSGWVYSTGPDVDIFLFMKRAGELGYYSSVDHVSTSATGKWVLIEKEYEVPADITQLGIRLDNNRAGSVWFDDIRLHPSKSLMTTYTYDPLISITSQSDANNRTTYYDYDRFGRLKVVKDQDGKILKAYDYKYGQ